MQYLICSHCGRKGTQGFIFRNGQYRCKASTACGVRFADLPEKVAMEIIRREREKKS